ncbi:hypothetical protein QQ045_030672 [Rhodiola kirilowii]
MAPSKRSGKEVAHSDQRGQSCRYTGHPHRGAYGRYLNEPLHDGDEVGPYVEINPNWEASLEDYERARRAASLPPKVVGDNSSSQPKCGQVSRHGMLSQHSAIPLSPVSHRRGHNLQQDLPSTDFVKKGSSSRVEPQSLEDYPCVDTRHRQLIRPVEPSSFSPQEVEVYIRASMGQYIKPEWKDLEDVDPDMFIKCFNVFKSITKWAPNDEESIRECFGNKFAEILRERLLPLPAGKSKEGPNKQSSKDMTPAGKSKQGPDRPSRDDLIQQKYYSSADPAGNGRSQNKRARREKLVGDQNMHGEDISGARELKNDYGELKLTEDGFEETGQDEGCNAAEVNMHIPMACDESDDSDDSNRGLVPLALVLAGEIKSELKELINSILPNIVRNVLRNSSSWTSR